MSESRIPATVENLHTSFARGLTRSLSWRQRQLSGLSQMLIECEQEICEALRADMGRAPFESYLSEIGFLRAELRHAQRRVARWMRPRRAATHWLLLPSTARVRPEPLGVALIIGPWNYPFQLTLAPLIGALAAGNCAVIKPSELAVHSSALLARRIPEYLDPECVQVVEGGVPETTELLAQRFEHIFYTGNGTVGRIVLAAASRHLTPVTLELGGKNPCYVHHDADLEVTARRICWAKFLNAGQTCVAPDHLLVHERVHDALLERLAQTLRGFFGPDPQRSPDYSRIINTRHHARLTRLLGSGRVYLGGEHDADSRYLAPTVLVDVEPDAPVMQEEIFGPILPVFQVAGADQALEFAAHGERPLAAYLFSQDEQVRRRFEHGLASGALVVNHAMVHLGVPTLPFGGVGESGMGAYHGKYGFDTFSHHKTVLSKPFRPDQPLLYPPYRKVLLRLLRRVM